MTVVELTDKEVEFLTKMLRGVTLPGVDVARHAVSLAAKIGMKADDPDGN